jgi:hypothetical protein
LSASGVVVLIFIDQMLKNTEHNSRIAEPIIHVLLWSFIFSIPLLTERSDRLDFINIVRLSILPFLIMLSFYANFVFIIPRYFVPNNVVKFITINLFIFVCCFFIISTLELIFFPFPAPDNDALLGPPRPRGPEPRFGNLPILGLLFRMFIAFSLSTGIAVAIHATKKWFKSKDEIKELERAHLKSELLNLKNQLNPHFFFNTLNNIYSLVIQDQEKAQEAIIQLSKMMRYLLYNSNEKFVPLTREVEFLHHYIDLMKLRVTQNVKVEYALPTDTKKYFIAPLLFIALVENSFKHGISSTRSSEIWIEMKINENDEVELKIENTAYPKTDEDRSGSGIGIENLKKRLTLLYPERHSMNITLDEKYYCVILRVQL